ncbi:MAG TPA: preprotein translocase subunit SecG [Gammaproteobacteria bacterium]|nr:preprotein translocase subunit SecG [Gammaproteobacteria bacterium]
MLMTVLLVFHVLMAAALTTLILIQRGRGAEAGAAFGSGASATVFGARGSASFLSRTTAILATLFFINCFVLWHLSNQQAPKKSLMESVVTAPAGKTPVNTAPPVNEPADVPAKPGMSTPVQENSPAPVQAAGAERTAPPAPESKPADVPTVPPAPKN